MDKEGFVINIDDVPDVEKVNKKEKVVVQVEESKAEETKKETETVKVIQEDSDLITILDKGDAEAAREREAEEAEEKETPKEEVKETEDKSKAEEKAEKPEETESPSFLHATALKEKGLLPSLDLQALKGKSDEDIIRATIDGTQDEIEATVKSIVEQQDTAYQQFIEVLNSGVDLDEYVKIKSSRKRFDGISDDSLEENEDISKSLITEDMKNRGFEDDEILDTIEELVEKDKLATKAKPALRRLKKRDADREEKAISDAAKAEADQKQRRVETMKKIDTTLEGTKEIIPGIPVTARERQVMKKLMTVPAETRDGIPISRAQQIRAEDPVQYEAILSYYIAIGLFDKNPSWEKVLKRANTDATEKIMKTLRDNKSHTPGKTAARQIKQEDDGPIEMPFI